MSRQNRIERRFADLAAAGRNGLIPFVTAGDPSREATVPVLHALVNAGADLLEIGVPFSDPMADGPTIQRASERALERGVGLAQVLDMVRAFRQQDDATPIVLMGYLNPFERDPESVFDECSAAGVDGVLLVDCPVEEAGDLGPRLKAAGLSHIFLTAPTTTEARTRAIAARASGFVYCVAFAGVTGADRLAFDDIANRTAALRGLTDLPIAVGFGIKDASDAARIARCADAVVIGSALVAQLADAVDVEDAAARAAAFLAPIRASLDALGDVAETGS